MSAQLKVQVMKLFRKTANLLGDCAFPFLERMDIRILKNNVALVAFKCEYFNNALVDAKVGFFALLLNSIHSMDVGGVSVVSFFRIIKRTSGVGGLFSIM